MEFIESIHSKKQSFVFQAISTENIKKELIASFRNLVDWWCELLWEYAEGAISK